MDDNEYYNNVECMDSHLQRLDQLNSDNSNIDLVTMEKERFNAPKYDNNYCWENTDTSVEYNEEPKDNEEVEEKEAKDQPPNEENNNFCCRSACPDFYMNDDLEVQEKHDKEESSYVRHNDAINRELFLGSACPDIYMQEDLGITNERDEEESTFKRQSDEITDEHVLRSACPDIYIQDDLGITNEHDEEESSFKLQDDELNLHRSACPNIYMQDDLDITNETNSDEHHSKPDTFDMGNDNFDPIIMNKSDEVENSEKPVCVDMDSQPKDQTFVLKNDDYENNKSDCDDSKEKTSCQKEETDHSTTKDVNPPVEKVNRFRKFDNNANAGSCCAVCFKTVYPVEKVMMDLKCFHKGCFKCGKCGKTLSPTTATKLNDNLFCKPHYIEMFRKRGRYDDICVKGENDNQTERVQFTSRKSVDKSVDGDNVTRTYGKSFSEYSSAPKEFPPRKDSTERIMALDTDSCTRVANTRKAWEEGKLFDKTDGRIGNSNNNNNSIENDPIPKRSGGKIKTLAALFESN